MKSKRTRKFRELYDDLPEGVRRQADRAYDNFAENPSYPALNFKQLDGDPVWYSARIGINYRALCIRDGDTYVWFWIGSHAEYDNLLKQRKGFPLLFGYNRKRKHIGELLDESVLPFGIRAVDMA